jgi:hypothetical protein
MEINFNIEILYKNINKVIILEKLFAEYQAKRVDFI